MTDVSKASATLDQILRACVTAGDGDGDGDGSSASREELVPVAVAVAGEAARTAALGWDLAAFASRLSRALEEVRR